VALDSVVNKRKDVVYQEGRYEEWIDGGSEQVVGLLPRAGQLEEIV
jgi:hypothetical protein